MINTAAPMAPVPIITAGLAPLMAICQSIRAPSFSGEASEWIDFTQSWNRHISLLQENVGGFLSDSMKCEVLLNCLDSDNRSIVQSKYDSGVKFDAIWLELDKRYSKDSLEYHRALWRQLELAVEGLNEDSLRKFKTEWDKRRARVEDATEDEERDLLLRRVGPIWAKRILVEEEKRTRNQFGVKISKFGLFTQADFANFVTRIIGDAPQRIIEDQGWYKVVVTTEEAEKRLLNLKGKKVSGGFELKVFRSSPKMTPAEIFSWLTRDVRLQDTMVSLEYHPRGVFRKNSPVREISSSLIPQISEKKGESQPQKASTKPIEKKEENVKWTDQQKGEQATSSPKPPAKETKTQNNQGGKGNKGKGSWKGGGNNWWGANAPNQFPPPAQQYYPSHPPPSTIL